MKTWKVELTAGGKRLAEAKVQRGIFQGDALLPLLFIIEMIPLNHALRKCSAGVVKDQSPDEHGYQTVCKKLKRIGNSNKHCENIQSGHRDGIWHRKMRHARNEKRQTNGTTKLRQN